MPKVDLPPDTLPYARRWYLSNEYEPIPIFGKAPLWRNWRNEPITKDLLDRIEADPRYANHTNTGLKTGQLAVVDIDLRDPVHAAALEEEMFRILGHTYFVRVGSKGMALCYYNSQPISKITIVGKREGSDVESVLIEFLGEGQQMAAFGIHPDTGRPYRWPNQVMGGHPFSYRLSKLPPVSPSDLQAAASAAQAKLISFGYRTVVVHGAAGRQLEPSKRNGDPVPVSWLYAALNRIPPSVSRHDWLRVLWAVKEANLVPDLDDAERIELLDQWSKGELGGSAHDR
jgi:hypothetical protein